MKKIALIASLIFVSMFGMKNIYANNDNDKKTQTTTVSKECTAEPQAYVDDVTYDLDEGTISVKVCIKNGDGDCHRVKITPKDQITGVVVEGSLYVNAGANCGCNFVTFHCYSGKEGDAKMCRAYTFVAEIVN